MYRARDGKTGLELAARNPVSLVLLDLRLPGLNGWEVIKGIKADPAMANTVIVVLTASAGKEDRARALEAGAAEYLVKPLSASAVKEAVGRLVGIPGTERPSVSFQ